ncbi:glutathione hydrolase 1 proenzyme-like [Asterias amurensis]|uniref:glutathione hydrolase 1 proenzyme-like n=1 Tax=Asterias amurensis TaxID=7602 RepID=UPI003AB85BB0
MDNDGYEDPSAMEKPSKQGQPQGFDDVDLSVSASVKKGKHHSDPPKYNDDVEASKKTSGDKEKRKGVPSCWFVALVLLLGVGVIAALLVGLYLGHPDPALDPYQLFGGAVSSDHKLCSEVGRDIMINGGNSIDAAIATVFCVGVVNLQVGGIGGGGFLTFYHKANGTVLTIDSQVAAPAYAEPNMFNNSEAEAFKGGRAIAIPGEVAGLYNASKLYGGDISWAALLEPSIRLAKGGFAITESLANAMTASKEDILEDVYMSNILAPEGVLKSRGDTITLPHLADTLKKIAKDGAKGFYEGSLAEDIVADVAEAGGNITLEDLKHYSSLVKKPVSVELGGGQLYAAGGIKTYAPPPPSSGIVTTYILNLLEGYDFSLWSVEPDKVVETYHHMLEAFKFAFANRSRLGDPAFEKSVGKAVNEMLSSSTSEIRAEIKDTAQDFSHYGSVYATQTDTPGGATHVSVVDRDGNAVSYTTSISLDFGAKRRGNRTGIQFNAGMGDFTLPSSPEVDNLKPSPKNYIMAGKRPLSSMSPMILVEASGEVKAVVGASGGSEMITSTAMMAIQSIWFEENVIAAMKRSRIHTELTTDNGKVTFKYEQDLPENIKTGLTSKGHIGDASAPPLTSSVNMIMQTKKNRFYTNSDTRVTGSGYAVL